MPDLTLLLAQRLDPSTSLEESEPILASVRDGRLVLALDDGETISLDASEVGGVLKDAA